MATRVSCHSCVYAYWDVCQAMIGMSMGFPTRPACANQPDSPGRMMPTPIGAVCRNYRPRPATPKGDVKPIQLVEGLYAYVETIDYEWVRQYNWHLSGSYAVRCVGHRRVFMHREIMKPPDGMVVDHKDGNGLNNCRFNLRVCTPEQNQWNRVKRINANTGSPYMGVGYRKSEDRYYARFRHRGERYWLGLFDHEIDAARAYDFAAVEHRGEFARVNLPDEWPPERCAQVHNEYLRTGIAASIPTPTDPPAARGKKAEPKEAKKAKGGSREPPRATSHEPPPHGPASRERRRKASPDPGRKRPGGKKV